MKFKKGSYLFLILLLAAFLRFWQLGINPPGFTWDEAAWGYNAYSLGLDGRDEFGRFLPLDYLESFGDFKPPLYAYLTVLPVKIWGLTEFATRFASAFLGTLTVFLTYSLVRELFPKMQNSNLLALCSMLILAFSPWHIMLSRAAFEANIATFLIMGGLTFFLRGLRSRGAFLSLSSIFFALSLSTFNTARIVSPLLVFILAAVFRKELWQKRKWVFFSLLLGMVLISPALSHWLSPQAKLRYQEVNIFTDPSIVETANQEIANDNWAWWSRLLHNRRWGYTRSYLRHYFDHFNPEFLFISGDGNPKFSTQDVGQMFLWDLPFLVGGVLLLIKSKPGHWWLLLVWLLIGIIPAATARETPHALRIETTLSVWQILVAFGLVSFIVWLKDLQINFSFKRLNFVMIFFVFILNFSYFYHGYWRHYPVEYSGEWQYGYQPVVDYLEQVEVEYDQIWFTRVLGRPYIYVLFYSQVNPEIFREQAVVEREVLGFVNVRRFAKYHFFRPGEELKIEGRALVVDIHENLPAGTQAVKEFPLLNGDHNLVVYER